LAIATAHGWPKRVTAAEREQFQREPAERAATAHAQSLAIAKTPRRICALGHFVKVKKARTMAITCFDSL
jgi:hypothetical protein